MTTNSPAKALVDSDREFWHGVLTAGGFTPIRGGPGPGARGGRCEARCPATLPALRQRAAELGVPLSSVLLAAHAKVLAALSGESEVVTGYAGRDRGVPLPCRLATAPGSWRALLLAGPPAESELLAHQDFPVDDLRRELGLTGPAFETVFDPLGGEGDAGAGHRAVGGDLPHAAAGSCCGCGTGPTCSTRTRRPGSPAITSPRWR